MRVVLVPIDEQLAVRGDVFHSQDAGGALLHQLPALRSLYAIAILFILRKYVRTTMALGLSESMQNLCLLTLYSHEKHLADDD